MKRSNNVIALAVASLFCLNTYCHAQTGIDSIANAINTGTHKLSLRLRHESVEQDNTLQDADATTLRIRLSLQSGVVGRFSGLLEIDDVSAIGADEYDSFVLDKYRGSYSIIADPVGTEINQASINYKINDDSDLKLGRQRINHANQRFVGGIGWRQNEQTFDAVSYKYDSVKFSLNYSYLSNVNRIFNSSKPSVQPGNLDSDSHIVIGGYKPEWGTLSSFIYALEFDDVAGLSSITYGISYAGKIGPINLNASLATQSDYGNASISYGAEYYSLDASIMTGPIKLLAGYEVLGSDNGNASFKTPLATLHKWQGWTDLFLNTPVNGVEDTFFTASGSLNGFTLAATYHSLKPDFGGGDYGNEIDLSIGYRISPIVNTQLKYASYSTDSYAVDTDKLWVSLIMNF